jgi:hypothetical protein
MEPVGDTPIDAIFIGYVIFCIAGLIFLIFQI